MVSFKGLPNAPKISLAIDSIARDFAKCVAEADVVVRYAAGVDLDRLEPERLAFLSVSKSLSILSSSNQGIYSNSWCHSRTNPLRSLPQITQVLLVREHVWAKSA